MTETTGILEPFIGKVVPWLFKDSYWWSAVGYAGGAMFSSRFIIQWWYSEKLKRIVVPPIFWHQSLWGSVFNAAYAVHIDKMPIILGSFFLPFIYARNLWLLKNGTLPKK